MNGYIEREAALAMLHKDEFGTPDERWHPESEIAEAILRLPAADVVPVVFCRDCKHKGWVQEPEHGKSVDYCHLIERCVDKQFFCAAGERKTNCDARMDGEA